MSAPVDVVPIPPRFWWLKRLALASAILVVSLIALRLTWGHIAHARLQREIDHYRALGQPVTLEEFNAQLAAVAPADNAVLLYEEAWNLLVSTASDGSNFDTFLDDPSAFTTKPAAAQELITRNASVYDLIRKARDRKQVAWSGGITPTSAFIMKGSFQRQLARLFCFDAIFHFRTGDHERAMDTLLDFLRYTDAIAEYPEIIAQLIAWGCETLLHSAIEDYGRTLCVEGNDCVAGTPHPARREQVNQLQRSLLDDASYSARAQRAWRGGNAWLVSFMLANGDPRVLGLTGVAGPLTDLGGSIENVATFPLLVLEARRTMILAQTAAEAVREAHWPSAMLLFQASITEDSTIERLAFPLTSSPWRRGSEQSTAKFYFRHLATRRMAAIALAIRLYELDNGHRPVELAFLVPDYLPTLPIDPFRIDRASFQYTFEYPLDSARALLYSLGPDGTDDGGALRSPQGRLGQPGTDILIYLDPEPPKVPQP